MTTLEICAGSIESVLAAREGSADRVELCAALEVGGITPSAGLIAAAREVPDLQLHVLIRPRGGDFLYDAHEARCMEHDIRLCRDLGVDGVVIGALSADGNVDAALCRRLVQAAEGMSITFHRAFDMCRDPHRALEEIIDIGCHRLLTSGQAASALEGAAAIKQLNAQAAGRLILMPGCGVSSRNAAEILKATGASEIHASARHEVGSRMLFRHEGVSMGNKDADEYARKETCASEVRAIVEAIRGIGQ